MPFATTSDLQQRWRTFKPGEQAKAELILGDVERDIRRAFPDIDTRMASNPDLSVDVTRVACNVARRRLVELDAEDVEDIAENGGIFGRRQSSEDDGLTAHEQLILAGPASSSVAAAGLPVWSNEPEAVTLPPYVVYQ